MTDNPLQAAWKSENFQAMKCLQILTSDTPHIPTAFFFLTHLPKFKEEEFSVIPSLS